MTIVSKGPNPDPGAIVIKETATNVTGTYPLYHTIFITTKSGNIDISIQICANTPCANHPAKIVLSTISGNITVTTVDISDIRKNASERVFTTDLKSTSGLVSATLPHSTSTSISTTSGNLTAILHPIKPSTDSHIFLNNTSGNTRLTLCPSLVDPPAPMPCLSTTVKGISGNVELGFPLNWEGGVECRTTSGNIKCDWPGLKISRSDNRLSGSKGDGQGTLLVDGKSSNIALLASAYNVGSRKEGGEGEKEEVTRQGNQQQAVGNVYQAPGSEVHRRATVEDEEVPPPSYNESMKM
ncbi:MAG: hypothetical protein Q9164_006863 [Protoblastenia rupestris]